jgi:hypothetical protein
VFLEISWSTHHVEKKFKSEKTEEGVPFCNSMGLISKSSMRKEDDGSSTEMMKILMGWCSADGLTLRA